MPFLRTASAGIWGLLCHWCPMVALAQGTGGCPMETFSKLLTDLSFTPIAHLPHFFVLWVPSPGQQPSLVEGQQDVSFPWGLLGLQRPSTPLLLRHWGVGCSLCLLFLLNHPSPVLLPLRESLGMGEPKQTFDRNEVLVSLSKWHPQLLIFLLGSLSFGLNWGSGCASPFPEEGKP